MFVSVKDRRPNEADPSSFDIIRVMGAVPVSSGNFYKLMSSKSDALLYPCGVREALHRKVYDVTSYLDEHPAGDDVVLAVTGKDATDDFEDAGHNNNAKELMQNFCIGKLDTSSPIIPKLEISSKKEATDYSLD